MHSRCQQAGFETENCIGDPRSGSGARGFIDFDEERGNDHVLSEGLRNMCQAGRASCWEG